MRYLNGVDGWKRRCEACTSEDIFVRSSGPYGDVDLCYTHAEQRCPGIEVYNTPHFDDHIQAKYERSSDTETLPMTQSQNKDAETVEGKKALAKGD